MVQILASILFFYVFLLAAVVLTVYVVAMCIRFLRDARTKQKKPSQ